MLRKRSPMRIGKASCTTTSSRRTCCSTKGRQWSRTSGWRAHFAPRRRWPTAAGRSRKWAHRPDSAAALAVHDEAIAMEPNSVIHLWMAGIRLSDFGRHDEALQRIARAVELTQRGPLVVGMYARALALAGRRAEALAVREELRQRASREYIGPGARLMMVSLDFDDEEKNAAVLRENIDAMTGPTAIATTVAREPDPLLEHPRLGPVVRGLTYWATSPLGHRSAGPWTRTA